MKWDRAVMLAALVASAYLVVTTANAPVPDATASARSHSAMPAAPATEASATRSPGPAAVRRVSS